MKFIAMTLVLFISVACGHIPVPKNSDSSLAKPMLQEEPAVMEPAESPVVAVKQETTQNIEPAPQVPAEKSVSAEENVQNGVTLLLGGKVAEAKDELYAALRKDPGNIDAVNLVHQINTDAVAYFSGENFFRYEIKPGETLPIIAENYLHDPLKFFILAKYNDIQDSSQLGAGRIIKIPGKTSTETDAIKAQQTKATDVNKNNQYALAERYYNAGNYREAIDVLEKSIKLTPNDIESRDLLVLTYTRYAETLTEKADLLEAQTMLEKALSMQPRNVKLQRQLEELEKRREADQFYQIGITVLQAGNEDKAYSYFQKALKLQPNHTLARKQIVGIKSDVINSYHKKALQFYSKQQLLKAVENWDHVLEIDPSHELARLYRARALELQERLNNLEGD
jgi:Tfp pilus assembly protein PilF